MRALGFSTNVAVFLVWANRDAVAKREPRWLGLDILANTCRCMMRVESLQESLRSGGATTLISMVDGARAASTWSCTRQCQRAYNSTRKQDVAVAIFANVRIGHHDGLECGVMDSACILAHEVGLRQYLGAAEALTANGDDVAVWMLTGLLLVRALGCLFHFCIEVQSDVAELLLDIKTNLVLGCFSRTLP